ncbi:hypothetical protein EHS25_003168 [Saitozyma podzolica]|uniref:DUF7729 domain-containing protein n=1 Tax=Saitozyma podzolica TaxID=1890683 RepID=A0A427Y844_9TREE|nr:hypothetical protein EHS25_003168 [Saitozyma podzolica]
MPSPHTATLRRQSRRANTTVTTSASASSSSASSSSSNASASLPLRPSAAPASPPSPVPTPLDTSISYALSDSCLLYLTSLLQATTFQSCLPFSLLLSTSSSYAQLVSTATNTNNYTTLNELLAYSYSPQPSGDQCDSYMQGVLSDMGGKSNCQADIAAKKVVALEAKIGVGTYAVVRQAENLIDPDTGVYCYLEALASDRPDDLYLWSLPQGIALPSTSTPTCSKCSSLLLSTLSSASNSTSGTLNNTLVNNAISTVNSACGSAFISLSANQPTSSSKSGAGAMVKGVGAGGIALVSLLSALAAYVLA